MEFFDQPSFPIIRLIWIASPIAWILYGIWWSKNGPLSMVPRRPVPWGMIDIVILLAVVFLSVGLAAAVLKSVFEIDVSIPMEDLNPSDRATVIVASSGAALIATIIGLVVIALKNGATMADLGVRWKYIRDDLLIGTIAFMLLVGPVLLIQGLLVLWWPSKHPLIELVMKNPDPVFFAVSGFAAVAVAPFAEEFTYRVILQGWMERAATHRGDPMRLLIGGVSAVESHSDEPEHEQVKAVEDLETTKRKQIDHGATPIWPVFASAAIFALMHLGHGPDPIPLFVFAIGLGYLYRQTHRALPCIVVHFLLNAVSLTVLIVDAYGAKA